MEELIQKNVEERLNSEETKLEIKRRIEGGRKKLFDDVDVQLEKERSRSYCYKTKRRTSTERVRKAR